MNQYSYQYNKLANELKTKLVLKWNAQYIKTVQTIRALRLLQLQLPRTKSGKIYKRSLEKFNIYQTRIQIEKHKINSINAKYWRLRKQENAIQMDQTAKHLFGLWSNNFKIK